MPSPFPGMDPYLEAAGLWPGVHQRLITYISDDLQSHIRPDYHARIGERLYVVESSRDIYPDVALPEPALSNLPPHRYLVSVNRAPDRHRFELYPIPLAQRLPCCRIPLKAPDPDVALDLPAIFTRCYDNGGYSDFVDYHQPPPAPLSEEEQKCLDFGF